MNIFEDYQGTPIFEIPIYAYSKAVYRERWKNKEQREQKKLMEQGYSKESAEKIVNRSTEYPSIWQYNRLVGMLLLTVKKEKTIFFHLYCDLKGPRSILQRTQLPFINQFLINESVGLDEIYTDEDLVHAIKTKIEHLKFQYGISRYYFDCTSLENSISLQKIMGTILQNEQQ